MFLAPMATSLIRGKGVGNLVCLNIGLPTGEKFPRLGVGHVPRSASGSPCEIIVLGSGSRNTELFPMVKMLAIEAMPLGWSMGSI